jgi:FkbM family methyltransferase
MNSGQVAKVISDCYVLPKSFSALESGVFVQDELEFIESRKWIDEGQNVWMVEADPLNYIGASKKKLQVLNFAFSDHLGQVEFNRFRDIGWSAIAGSKDNDASESNAKPEATFEVACITFEKVLEITGTIFDVMILDIEGGENTVLKDMQKTSKEKLPKVLCVECGYDWLTRKQLVKDLGYEIDFYFENNAFFSQPNTIEKNEKNIFAVNVMWPKLIYRNKVIYENEC